MLPDEHPAIPCVQEALELEGFDVMVRVMAYYS